MLKLFFPLVFSQVIFSASAVLPQEGCYTSEDLLTESGGLANLHMNFGSVVSFAVNTTDSQLVVCLSEPAVIEMVSQTDGAEEKLTVSVPLSDCLSSINDVIGGISPAFPSLFEWRKSLNLFLDADYAISLKPSGSCPAALMAVPLTTSTSREPVSREQSAVAEDGLPIKAVATNGETLVPSIFLLPITLFVVMFL
jgi:hypothetical protein